jgi:hypothetical protein
MRHFLKLFGRRLVLPIHSFLSRTARLPHCRHESVSTAWHGHDVSAVLRVFTKQFPQCRDVHGKVDLFHKRAWPNLFQKFVLTENPPLIAHQDEKGVKDLGRGRQSLSVAPQDAFLGVHRKRAEFV